MFVVGLTGGIGTGKSTVSTMFEQLGITIVDTDIIARHVVEPGSECLQQIYERYGESIVNEEGYLNRKRLRSIIFSDPDEKTWLESLLHPVIRKQTKKHIAESKSQYTILASPLLLESPDINLVDRILIVDLPKQVQYSRTASRDNTSVKEIENIAASQSSREFKQEKADDVIDNSGSVENTQKQVKTLHEVYLHMSEAKV